MNFQRPKILMISNTISTCKNQWAAFWSNRTSNIVYGKILRKSHFPSDIPKVYLEHYIPNTDLSLLNPSSTPRSQKNLVSACLGCVLQDSIYVGDVHWGCVISVPSNYTNYYTRTDT